jgi:hypothetical protein
MSWYSHTEGDVRRGIFLTLAARGVQTLQLSYYNLVESELVYAAVNVKAASAMGSSSAGAGAGAGGPSTAEATGEVANNIVTHFVFSQRPSQGMVKGKKGGLRSSVQLGYKLNGAWQAPKVMRPDAPFPFSPGEKFWLRMVYLPYVLDEWRRVASYRVVWCCGVSCVLRCRVACRVTCRSDELLHRGRGCGRGGVIVYHNSVLLGTSALPPELAPVPGSKLVLEVRRDVSLCVHAGVLSLRVLLRCMAA